MTYDVFEKADELGQPIELYEFSYGLETLRYTSAEDQVTYSANLYLPRPMMRTAPTAQSGGTSRQQMEITINADDPIARRYVGIVPAERVTVTVTRFHRGDSPNGVTLWIGRIVSAKFEENGRTCKLYSVSSESALSRPTPGRKYQGLCNHVLYDGFCQVAKASFQHTDTVTGASGDTVTVNGVGSLGSTWAVGGTVKLGAEERLIVAQSGNVLSLQIPFPTSPVGATVDVFAGCDHSIGTCESKFSNVVNFGGFPYVPTRNPFNSGLD